MDRRVRNESVSAPYTVMTGSNITVIIIINKSIPNAPKTARASKIETPGSQNPRHLSCHL